MSSRSPSELDQRIQDALNAAKMALWEFDIGRNAVNWTGKVSPHFYEFSRSFDGSLTGYLSLVHPDDLEDTTKTITQAGKGQSFVKQHRARFPDGKYHWLEGIGSVVISQDGLKLTGTVQDISDKKQIETEAEDWRQKHEMVANAAGIVVYDYSVESGEIKWSDNTFVMLGHHDEDINNIEAWEEKIHPEDRKVALHQLDLAMEKMKPYNIQYRFRKKDGDHLFIHDKGFFLGNEKATRMLGMMQDITENKQFELALKESEERFKSLILDMNIGVALYDTDTKPILCNRKSFELLGMSEEQFMGRAAMDPEWRVIHEDGSEFVNEDFPIPKAIRTKEQVKEAIMGVFQPESKNWVWLLVDALPIFDSGNQLINVICTYSDISALRKSQSALNEKNKQLTTLSNELKARNERLLEFAQIVSHNLRSPISSIVSLTRLFKEGDEELRDRTINHIDSVGNNALKTIDELNDVLKVQQEEVKRKELIFDQILERVLSNHKGMISDSQVEITREFNVPRLYFPKIYLESIILNLLSNSIKYRSPDRVCKLSIVTKKNESGDTMMEWRDNGIGIDLSLYKNDVFQLGKTFHENSDSRGVGLFLIKNQIRTMGGSIHMTSEIDKGTTFIINFTKYLETK